MESVKVKVSCQHKELSPRAVLPLRQTNTKLPRDNSQHNSTYPSWWDIFHSQSGISKWPIVYKSVTTSNDIFANGSYCTVRQPNSCAHLTFPHVPDDIISVSGFSLLQRWSCVHSPTVFMQLCQVRLLLSRTRVSQFASWTGGRASHVWPCM
jgi:hypothetical protein